MPKHNVSWEPSRHVSSNASYPAWWRKLEGVGACLTCGMPITSDYCRECTQKKERELCQSGSK